MTDRIVINTGPLIALAQAEALDIAGNLPFTFLCPDEVRAELDSGAAGFHADLVQRILETAGE